MYQVADTVIILRYAFSAVSRTAYVNSKMHFKTSLTWLTWSCRNRHDWWPMAKNTLLRHPSQRYGGSKGAQSPLSTINSYRLFSRVLFLEFFDHRIWFRIYNLCANLATLGSWLNCLPRISFKLWGDTWCQNPLLYIAERYKFHKCVLVEGQSSVCEFLAKLQELSETCDFGSYRDYRLVCGRYRGSYSGKPIKW